MIQWYPGHMAKAIREIGEKIKLVDLVMIVLDARIPYSSMNPVISDLVKNKKVLYIYTKKDKCDFTETAKFIRAAEKNGIACECADVRSNQIKKILEAKVKEMFKEKREKDAKKGLKERPIRTMILGIPNVGKSTLINTLAGKKVAATGDKPGVTKSEQWIRMSNAFELLDTPGVLWPKFDDETVAYNLAVTGAIKDDIMPVYEVALYAIKFFKSFYPESFTKRYPVDLEKEPHDILVEVCQKLNFLKADKSPDEDKTAKYLLQELRQDRLGKVTFDRISYESKSNENEAL